MSGRDVNRRVRVPAPGRRARTGAFLAVGAAIAAWLVLAAGGARAELCWNYTDNENAKVPLKCVEMGDPTASCTWRPDCNTDGDPSDCCIAVHDPTATQTIGEMHVIWHECLGNVGTSETPPPPNRGLRWYAFHRQFEADFNEFREGLGLGKIDSLEWCPGMNMPYGHFGGGWPAPPDPAAHPLGCGTGVNRPNNVACDGCETFRRCLYLNGAGPAACPAPANPVCSAGGVTFPYTSLDQFQNTDEIATLLDVYFHGDMHGAVSDADGGGYVADCSDPNCSPRDGMFWRLHKALDDVVRAWQDLNAVDVTLVIDRSGSMSLPSGTGVGSRMDNALEAADMFADLLEDGRSDGAVNRIGVVSYSSDASNAALNLPMQDVDSNLRNAGGAFATTLAALSPGGSTSIGSGIDAAVDQLCPGGSCATHVPAAGENERKAILLLTDGKENRAPCLEAGCQGGGGAEIDYTTLDVTQLCAVGLGNAASINGELLTLLAERQGGIYLNNTDTTGNDLKDFFAKCFAQLTDEFIGLDPQGTLAAAEPATEIVPYESCDENRLTFTAGWTRSDLAGDRLRLLVTSPEGDAWVPGPGYGETSTQASWAFKRSPLPFNGQDRGTWTMQLLRPQKAFVNGFTTDSFRDEKQGVRFVRREIQRLCPVGVGGEMSCGRVLYFEDGAYGPSAYKGALELERGSTIGEIEAVVDARALDEQLERQPWDLIVYARQRGPDTDEVYDRSLATAICQGTPAIVTDTRSGRGAASILRCAGAVRDREIENQRYLAGLETFLGEKGYLQNPGYPVFSYGVRPASGNGPALAAIFGSAGRRVSRTGAIVVAAEPGSDLHWHENVLVTGLTRLTPFAPISVPKTGDPLRAAVRILAPFSREGGYPDGRMTVEVERPLRGLGSLVRERGRSESIEGDEVDSLELQLSQVEIPTTRDVFELNDDGLNGDEHANNGTWSAMLPISAAVDGMYTFHYRFDYPVGSCSGRRELKQTLYVAPRTSPRHSELTIGEPRREGGGQVYPIRMTPQDALGNPIGPGRRARLVCQKPCACDAGSIEDRNDGSYVVSVRVPESMELSSCSIEAFGARFMFGERPRFPSRKGR